MKQLFSILLIGIFLVGFLYTAPVTEAQSTTQPVLLITNDGGVGKYGKFLGEILRAEGLNYFDTSPVTAVNAALLAPYQVVVLGKTTLTNGQATDLTNYVNAGGRLIAMQPDAQIKGLFGLNALVGTQTDGYLKISNSASFLGGTPGAGLTTETLQIHGSTAKYSLLGGAVMLAELYSAANTPTGYPAVVGKGSGSGWAVAYLYDLPANIILTRQGNPNNATYVNPQTGVTGDVDGDGVFRTIDLFQGTSTWVDLEKVPVPQADEQMRFFGRLVKSAANMPLPQLWYFPGTNRTMLVLTGDAHANPTSYFQSEIDSLNALGAKLTFYLSVASEPTDASVQAWRASGHEFGIHPTNYKLDEYPPYNVTNLTEGYAAMEAFFSANFSSPKSRTVRNHQVAWLGYTDAVDLQVDHGIAMDTDYYAWGPWLQKGDGTWAHGYVTGSGLPMKFVKLDGTILPVYQQVTQLVDEQMILGAGDSHFENLTGAEGVPISTALIDASQAGYYSALMTQFHVDYYVNGDPQVWAEGTLAYAQSQGIPMWNADQWLVFTEGRDATVYRSLSWSAVTGTLSFVMDAPVVPGGNFTTLIPAIYQGNALVGVQVDGVGVTPEMMDVNGVPVATVTLPGGVHNIVVSYHGDADLSITMTANPEPVVAGNNLTYAMSIHNSGPDVAQNVVVSDMLPVGVSFSSATATQGTCSGTSQVSCALGAIPSGGSAGVTLVVTVDPAKRSAVDNTATVSAQTIDNHVTNNTATTHSTVNAAANVGIGLTAPASVTAGTNLTYTLNVINAGPSTANGVSAVLMLGSGLTYQGYTGANWTCVESPAGTLTCTRTSALGVGSDSVQVTVMVAASQSASVSSTVSVTASETDGTPGNNTASAITTVTRSADVGITLTDSPDPVTAGTNLTYTLTASNKGPSTANNVRAVLTLGSGLTFQGSSGAGWSCIQAPVGTLTCTRGSALGVNSSDSVEVTVMVAASQSASVSSTANVTASEADGNSSNDSASATTGVRGSADVGITLTDSPDPVTAGTNLTYTLAVSNAGPSTANGVKAVLTLGSGLTYQGSSGAGWSCVQAPVGTLTCTRGSALGANSSDTVQVTVMVAASQSASASSTASVTASETDGNSSNDTTSAITTVTRSADVGVTLAGTPDPVTAGTNLTYTLAASNNGPSTANGVKAVLMLGSGLTYQGSSGVGWSCIQAPVGTLTCTRGNALGVNNNDSVQVSVMVAASQSATLSSMASVTASEADGNSSNDSSSATTAVMRSADMGITLTDSPYPVTAGTTLTYTLTASNAGPSTANNISAVLTLGAGLAYQVSSGANWTCVEGPVGTVTCSRGSTLGVNGSDSVQVTARVDPAQKDGVSSGVVVDADESDPAAGNNQSTAGTAVERQADILVQIVDAPDPIAASRDLTYTLTIQNAGPSTADAVAATDTLPVGVIFKSYTSSDWTCQHSAGVVTCDPRLLQPGSSGTIQIVVTAPSEQGVIENMASVSSSTPDSQTGNNSASAFTSVTPETDLSVLMVVNQDPARAGILMEYTLAVENMGVSSTSAISLTFTLPAGAGYVSTSGIGWTCNYAGDVVTCTMAQLPVGQAAPVTVRLLAPTIGSNMIAHAAVSSANADPVMDNNTTQLTTALKHVQYLPVVVSQP